MTTIAIVGAGPAGLMAAEVLAGRGMQVDVYDGMASAGRKFLLAGRGGLNLTHSEDPAQFVRRYGDRAAVLAPWVARFGAQAIREWAQGLGVETFIGTSGRIFPTDMKAAPLLRAWLHRLRAQGVRLHMRHRWRGWDEQGRICFDTPAGGATAAADALVLALGGASWARLGSDGAWVPLLQARGVDIAPLKPANCGFDVAGGWTPYFRERHEGQPFKSVAIRLDGPQGQSFQRKGEFVLTATGIEGSLVYAASALLRDTIAQQGSATVWLDLLPDRDAARVLADVLHPRGSRSLSSHLKSRLGLDGIKLAVLHERLTREELLDPRRLAAAIKALPIPLGAPRPLDEAISTAGGVRFEALSEHLMCTALPGVFCAGEMLDWEAPTGGYLMTASLATGKIAGEGVLRWLAARERR